MELRTTLMHATDMMMMMPHKGAEYCDECVYLSVCLSVCLRNRMSKLHEIFCECCMWPRLGSPLAALITLCISGLRVTSYQSWRRRRK